MIPIKANVIMLLVLCGLFSSGCAPVYLPCKAEEPARTYHKQCGGESNVTKFGNCANERWILIESDYDILLNRFRSCK